MSKTVFNKVDYDLGSLMKSIGLGEIGLPNIQRPFVWKNATVRDLFDSMHKGYPPTNRPIAPRQAFRCTGRQTEEAVRHQFASRDEAGKHDRAGRNDPLGEVAYV